MQAVLYPIPAKKGGRNTYLFQCILQHFQSVQRIRKADIRHTLDNRRGNGFRRISCSDTAGYMALQCLHISRRYKNPYRQKLSGFDIKTAAGINIAKTKFRQKTRGVFAHISGKPGQRFFYLVAI